MREQRVRKVFFTATQISSQVTLAVRCFRQGSWRVELFLTVVIGREGGLLIKRADRNVVGGMSASVRDGFRDASTTTFVRGGDQGTVSRKRKGIVNTAHNAAAFTAEESTSFYGDLVGLPSNVRLRLPSSGGNSAWGSDSSNCPKEATGMPDGIYRVPSGSVPSANLSESNIGFQLLKKSGWKEGTGLGAAEQGRLDPVETQLKQDRRGIGADLKRRNKVLLSSEERRSQRKALRETEDVEKEKVLSKKARKALAKAEHEREHALAAAFYRDFWPENV